MRLSPDCRASLVNQVSCPDTLKLLIEMKDMLHGLFKLRNAMLVNAKKQGVLKLKNMAKNPEANFAQLARYEQVKEAKGAEQGVPAGPQN